MSNDSETKPKIIVDEDYKSQVQAEKEALQRQKAQAQSQQQAPGPEAAAGGAAPPLPPASLTTLISTLATQAMVSLGQIANPLSGKAEVDLEQARHFIDTLAVLEEKTAGNRTPEESQILEQVLHDLRMAFVYVGQQQPSGA